MPFEVIDIRAELPFDAANLPWPITSSKESITVHWPGGDFDVVTDDDARNLIHAFAEEHIAKDWASEIPGVQGGAGIMYAEVIAPSGTVFLTRDPDAVLWHSNTSEGNATSRPILIITRTDQPPTDAQLRSLRARIVAAGLPAHPHAYWTQTACPGGWLTSFVEGGLQIEEDDMIDKGTALELVNEATRDALAAANKPDPAFTLPDTVIALKDALEHAFDAIGALQKNDADEAARFVALAKAALGTAAATPGDAGAPKLAP